MAVVAVLFFLGDIISFNTTAKIVATTTTTTIHRKSTYVHRISIIIYSNIIIILRRVFFFFCLIGVGVLDTRAGPSFEDGRGLGKGHGAWEPTHVQFRTIVLTVW